MYRQAARVLDIYADRTGVLATNTVKELREMDDDRDYVAGTLRDISLPGMPGIEFRTRARGWRGSDSRVLLA